MRFWSCLLLVFWMSPMLSAQVTTGTITGAVRDETGAVLPGAKVSVRNFDTGIRREVLTDSSGRYRAPQLSLGRYEAQAELAGFRTERRTGLTLTVGAEAVVDFVMQVGAVTETITVTGDAPLVETSGATVSALVGEREMADLPLNGRSFDQLIVTDAGAAYFRFDSNSSIQGFGTKFVVNGQRWESNKFYQDGTEMLGAATASDVPGSASGLLLGVDAIREFRVLTNNYSAEYGKKTGGVVTTVTKSGTNELHGSLFAFHRNDNFDARNFFDPGAQPEFKRNNFGASLGGPIRKDKLFLFGNYEGLRERLGITKIAIVPDENARRGLLPVPGTGQLRQITVSPLMVPYFTLIPLPDGRNFGDGTAESYNPASQPTNENYGTARVDYNISDSDGLFLSYTTNAATLDQPLENRFFFQPAETQNHTATLEEKHIFSPTLLHVFRVGFNRATYSLDVVSPVAIDPALSFVPGLPFGFLEFKTGIMSNVGDSGGPYAFATNLFQFSEQVIHTRGNHNLTLGWQLQRSQRNMYGSGFSRGSFRFSSVEDFLTVNPDRFRGAIAPGTTGTLNVGVGIDANETKGWRQVYGGFYAQDQWKVANRLSLDLGLRFEYSTVPQEVDGLTSFYVVDRVTPEARYMRTTPVVGKPIFNNGSKSLGPRFGLAWDPLGDGKTSVRAGVGMFFEQVDSAYRFFININPPFVTRADLTGSLLAGRFPRPFEGLDVSRIRVTGRTIDPDMVPATVFHYNLGLQRELLQGVALKLGYMGSKGSDLSNTPGVNLRPADILPDGRKFFPASRALANPILGPVVMLESSADSWYNAFKVEVEKRFGGAKSMFSNLHLKWAYTYAKSIDTASTNQNTAASNAPSQPLDPLNSKMDKSLSTFDVRQNVSFNFMYELPRAFSGGLGAHVFNDWSMNGFLLANTGYPFTAAAGFNRSRNGEESVADRPDLIPGGNNNPVLGGPDQYFDPLQFSLPEAGFYGNLGRNTLSAPGLVSFDFSLLKNISVSERYRLQFRSEFFNLFNRANFGIPGTALFDSTGVRVGAAGRIRNTVTTSRQIQFGLRFEF